MRKEEIVLHNRWALGDTVCLSALVRDVHKAYPGRYDLVMAGNYANVFWRNNPYCRPAGKDEPGKRVRLAYKDGIVAAGRGTKKHFLSWFHEDFKRQVGVEVPVTLPKGDVWLSPDERANRVFPHRYWLVVAGGKLDMTAKVWHAERYQAVVDTLGGYGLEFVQPGGTFANHFHPRLRNVAYHVGQTKSERDLFSLVYHCEGVVCGITSFMHLAAVFDKPCVVVAGGREEPWWEAYQDTYQPTAFGPACAKVKVPHEFLHTVGLLNCQSSNNGTKGCWKDRTVPIDRTDLILPDKINRLCTKPLRDGPQPVPACMDLVTTDHVIEAVMRYYEDGVIPPVGKPAKKYHLPVALGPGTVTDHKVDHSTFPPTEHVSILFETKVPVDDPSNMLAKLAPPPPLDLSALPQEVRPAGKEDSALAVLDHPYIGGKFTVCVLGYGTHLDLVARCLKSIFDHSPAGRVDVRVALNQPSDELLAHVTGYVELGRVSKLYLDRGTRKKYPAMREMFWDPACPITTKYVLWFDDDSWVIDPKWLSLLGREIVANHPQGARLYGTKYVHDLLPYAYSGHNPKTWFEQADWWQGRPMHMKGAERTGPNGHVIPFVTGGFWALAVETLRKANIPDVRLNHNGGDCTIGAQVWQAGGKIKDFCRGKKPVRWSDAKRRGYHEDFPWAGRSG